MKLINKVVLVVGLVAIPVVLFLFRHFSLTSSNAAGAIVSVKTSTPVLPPNRIVSVQVDSGTFKVGFAKVVLLFDKSKVNLVSEITLGASLTTQVVKTSMAEANSTGRIEISVGLPAGNTAVAPSGVVQIGSFTVTKLSNLANDSTTFSIDTANSQVADLTPVSLPIASQSLTLSLNPTATASPTTTAKPTVSPTLKPTNTPTATLVGAPVPPNGNPGSPAGPTGGPVTTYQVVWTPQSSSDVANIDGSTFTVGSSVWYGTGSNAATSYMGIRFSGKALPSGSTIVSATIGVSPISDTWISAGSTFYLEKNDSPVTYSTSNKFSGRALTASSVSYADNVKWVKNTYYYYDITAPVKEQLNGKSLPVANVIAHGKSWQWARKFLVYTGTYAPKLVITYSQPQPVQSPNRWYGKLLNLLGL